MEGEIQVTGRSMKTMQEIAEFRIPEDCVGMLFSPNEGKGLGSVRKINIDTSDPRFPQIGKLQAELRAQRGKPFFYGWDIRRYYSPTEIENAELFHVGINAVFEPAGEECDTIYDETHICPSCGAGRIQRSDLRLDLRKAPKRKDIARTIADDEIIVSQRLAELMLDAGLTGFQLRPVRHRARYENDPMDMLSVPAGQQLYTLAERQGITPAGSTNWEFIVWLNRPEQRELLEEADRQYVALCKHKGSKSRWKPPVWHQLVVTSKPVTMVPPTRAGNGPFDDDPLNEGRCPLGHVIGLNLLSEVFVTREDYDGSDIMGTKNMVGTRQGYLVPAPVLLISPRAYRVLHAHQIKGCKAEVAYVA